MSLRFCVDHPPSLLPHSPWGDTFVNHLFLCWRLPSLFSFQVFTLGLRSRDWSACWAPLWPPNSTLSTMHYFPSSWPLSDQATTCITLDFSSFFLHPLQPVNMQILLFFKSEELWNASFTVHRDCLAQAPSRSRYCNNSSRFFPVHSSHCNQGIFLSFRIKLQSDKFTSVLKSLHVFLLVIMVPAPLFDLNSRPHILCPLPACIPSNATFSFGYPQLYFPLPKYAPLQ